MFTEQLHPRAPAGGPAGGQFAAGSGGQKQAPPAKGGKPAAKPAAKKATGKNSTAAKAAQAKARSVPFAELKRLTTIANNGGKLSPAQQAIVNAGKTAHADHANHLKQVAAHPAKKATAKPKPKAAAKPKAATVKKATVAKPKTAGVASRL